MWRFANRATRRPPGSPKSHQTISGGLQPSPKNSNANIEAPNFWDYSTAAIEKGRVLLAGVENVEFDLSSTVVREQIKYFLELNRYNDFLGMFVTAAATEPHADPAFRPRLDRLMAMSNPPSI